MINDLRLVVFDCLMFHYFETTTLAWFVNLWCHVVKKSFSCVHRRKAVICDSPHNVFQNNKFKFVGKQKYISIQNQS